MTTEKKRNQEYYTPPWLIDLVLQCLGRIDLDPCANARKTVPAIRHYVGSAGQDGLAEVWGEETLVIHGNPPRTVDTIYRQPFTVFANPPFNNLDAWAAKMLGEFRGGHFTKGLLLVPVRVERPWFKLLRELSVWFPDERIHYYKEMPDGTIKEDRGVAFASCIFNFGVDEAVFERVFSPKGRIYECRKPSIATPCRQQTQTCLSHDATGQLTAGPKVPIEVPWEPAQPSPGFEIARTVKSIEGSTITLGRDRP